MTTKHYQLPTSNPPELPFHLWKFTTLISLGSSGLHYQDPLQLLQAAIMKFPWATTVLHPSARVLHSSLGCYTMKFPRATMVLHHLYRSTWHSSSLLLLTVRGPLLHYLGVSSTTPSVLASKFSATSSPKTNLQPIDTPIKMFPL